MPTIAVKDANGQTVTVARIPDTGQATAANSLPVTLASDQPALPLPTGAATAAAQATGNASLAAIDAKLPVLQGGAVPVAGTFWQSVQPVSFTWAGLTDAQLRATPVPMSAASLPLPTGAATAAAQTTGNTSLASIDGKLPALQGGAVPVAGTFWQSVQPVSFTWAGLTDAQLRATPVPMSAASLPLPTGAATSAAQTTGNTSLASIDAKTPALSGGSVPVTASALPLPTGAATSAAQTTGNTSLANIDGKLPAQVAGRVPVQSSVPAASSVVILAATTAATGTNWTAFGTQACVALDIVNNTTTTIEYRRGATGTAMQIPAGAARMVIGITNANQIDIRRTDLINTQVTVQAEAILA